jgi:hypothetical protein
MRRMFKSDYERSEYVIVESDSILLQNSMGQLMDSPYN